MDETAAVDEVQQARAGMQRAQKNVLRLLEAFYGLAERDDLADKLRVREPAARATEESAPARPATVAETTQPDPQPVPTVPEPSEALGAASQPPVPGAEQPKEAPGRFQVAARARLGAETAAIVPRELSSEPRAGSEDGSRGEVPPSPECPETAPSPVSTHPVRKVLRWLSVVPHRVETPTDGASPADPRVDADAA